MARGTRVNDRDALALLRPAVHPADGERWADLGAGTGTFTRALASLVGADGRVIAVDADDGALAALRRRPARSVEAPISVLHADVSRPLDLPPLDGVLMANTLHFLGDAPGALVLAAGYLRSGGRLVLIEYEGRRPSPWVPHPVSLSRFREMAAGAGLTPPEVVAMRPSAYGGEMYVAVSKKP
jgi:ubiquinone/menaquinone biosynthesis C-methylase UbiE